MVATKKTLHTYLEAMELDDSKILEVLNSSKETNDIEEEMIDNGFVLRYALVNDVFEELYEQIRVQKVHNKLTITYHLAQAEDCKKRKTDFGLEEFYYNFTEEFRTGTFLKMNDDSVILILQKEKESSVRDESCSKGIIKKKDEQLKEIKVSDDFKLGDSLPALGLDMTNKFKTEELDKIFSVQRKQEKPKVYIYH